MMMWRYLSMKMTVGRELLWDLRRQKHAVILEGIEQIGSKWFIWSKIKNVTVPASVCKIQANAFSYCRDLEKVSFKRSRFRKGGLLKVIDREAFCGCSNLRTIELPNGLEEIGIDAFRESGLERIIVPKSVETIR